MSTHALSPPNSRVALASVGVIVASICFGLVPYFARGLAEAGLAAHAIAYYRYLIAALLLLPFVWRALRAGEGRILLWGIGAGAAMGLGWIGYVRALEVAPVSTVGVLYMTYPVFTMLLAWALFAERPTRRALCAGGLVLLAAAVASSPAAVPLEILPALLLSLLAPAGFGLGIVVLVHRLHAIPTLARMGAISLGALLGLTPLVAVSAPQEVFPSAASVWALVLGIALVTALVPQLLYTICAPLVGAGRTAVLGSVELPTIFLVGLIAFGEAITLAQAIACALVLTAIWLTRSRVTRSVTQRLSEP